MGEESAKSVLTLQTLSEAHAQPEGIPRAETNVFIPNLTSFLANVDPATVAHAENELFATSSDISSSVDVVGNTFAHRVSPSENTIQSASNRDNLISNGKHMQEQDILGKLFQYLSIYLKTRIYEG